MTVAGHPAVIDSANELITVNLPLWDAAGEAVDASDVAVVLNGTGNVTVGETVVANDSSTRMDLTQAKRVTVGTGETQRTYDMVINRTIFDDFDEHTVFSGEVKGSATVQNAWEDGQTMISGAKASSIMKLDLINGLASDATYQPKVSAAVAPISTAKGLDGTTTIAVSPSSGAAGNALRLRKLKSLKGTNTGTALLKIAGDDFKDAKNAITIEYDMAFDYSNAEGDQWGLLGAGARYNHQNEAAVTDSAVNLSNKPDADSKIYPRIYYGSNITDQPAGNAYTTLMDCQTNAWMHVKIVIDVPNREAKTTVTLLNTATGKEVSKTASSGKLDGGTGDNSSDQDGTRPYKRATWNDQLNYTFATSSQRCADLWVDNLSIAYDVSSTQ